MKKSMAWGSVSVLVLFLALICIGCTKSGAPSCTDEAVNKLVLDISTEEILNIFTTGTMANTYPYMMSPPFNVPGNYATMKKMMIEATGERGDKEFRDHMRQIISTVDKMMGDAKISLTAVRLNGKDDKIKKCDCGGNLVLPNGKTVPITYTAQLTEDGKIYVEVGGLK
jgi:hypothetical protein